MWPPPQTCPVTVLCACQTHLPNGCLCQPRGAGWEGRGSEGRGGAEPSAAGQDPGCAPKPPGRGQLSHSAGLHTAICTCPGRLATHGQTRASRDQRPGRCQGRAQGASRRAGSPSEDRGAHQQHRQRPRPSSLRDEPLTAPLTGGRPVPLCVPHGGQRRLVSVQHHAHPVHTHISYQPLHPSFSYL